MSPSTTAVLVALQAIAESLNVNLDDRRELMAEMVDRVASAILAKVPVGYGMTGTEALEYAKIAIETIREPTEAMLNGARDWSLKVNGQGVGNKQATGCFQAMIDAALASTQQT